MESYQRLVTYAVDRTSIN